MGTTIRYYHGGVRGLKKGDQILPPVVTGNSTLLKFAKDIDPNGPQRADLIYLTTDINAARLFASVIPRGDIYEVIPDSELEHDPDCSQIGLSYQCSSATIKRVVEISVR